MEAQKVEILGARPMMSLMLLQTFGLWKLRDDLGQGLEVTCSSRLRKNMVLTASPEQCCSKSSVAEVEGAYLHRIDTILTCTTFDGTLPRLRDFL